MSEETTTDNTEQNDVLETILQNDELVAQLREKLVPQQASEEIQSDTVKENIQKAYEARDEALRIAEQLKAEKREGELKALEEAGKKEEADKLRMQELQKQLEEANARVTGLTRDNALRSEMASMDFTSDKAAEMAYREIVGTLIQDAAGNWVSPTGQSIAEYVKFYAADESNKFLFKVKQSSGSNSMATNQTPSSVQPSTNKPLSQMTEAEVLQAASEGRIGGDNWTNF